MNDHTIGCTVTMNAYVFAHVFTYVFAQVFIYVFTYVIIVNVLNTFTMNTF